MSSQTASIVKFPVEIAPPEALAPTVAEVIGLVCERCQVTRRDIASRRRDRETSYARHISMYLCAKHTVCSYAEIGRLLGNFDSSSVVHARRRIKREMRRQGAMASDIAAIEARLGGRAA
jgi:chromosomal replication initiator protein